MSFEGEIGEIDLVQRLVDLGRERFTGAIRFEQDGIIKIVYFKGGDVLSASTNDRTDAVDEILLRAGKVSKEHVKQALARRKENESLGDALLNLGFITRKELTWGRRIQVIGILRSVRTWDHGSYAIVADYLPKREEGTLFPLQQILIELYVTEQDRQPFERALDGGSAVLAKTDGFDDAFQRLGLNEEAAEIASKIDGIQTAAEIAASTGKDVFNTYKLLEAFRALGLVEKHGEEKPQVKDELEYGSLGVADAADAWSSGRMPAFETEPEPPVQPMGENAPPPPAAVAAPNPGDVQWGFDDAQIETATKAAAPPPPPPPPPPKPTSVSRGTQSQTRRTPPKLARQQPKKERGVPIFGFIVLLIVAGAGLGGWWWWKGQQATAQSTAAPVAPRPILKTTPAPQPPPTTTTFAAAVPAPQPAPAPAPAVQAQPQPQPPTRPRPQPQPRSPAKFTIQVELVCQQSSLKKAMDIGGGNIWSAAITYRGQQCYRVFWGRYETRERAEAATSEIPASLRTSKPVVVTIPSP